MFPLAELLIALHRQKLWAGWVRLEKTNTRETGPVSGEISKNVTKEMWNT